jgi:tetratricopeptide (TPR) repeat protein
MEYVADTLLVLSLMFFITRPFTVLFHELGHAIPALIFTRQRVTIYLGSHGNPKNSFKITIGLLDVWMRYSFLWKSGLCVPSEPIKGDKALIYIIGGPVASVMIAALAVYGIFFFDLHGSLKLLSVFFLLFAAIDLYINLVPGSTPIILHNGKTAYNDGYAISQLLYAKRYPKEWKKAATLYNSGEYGRAADMFEYFIGRGLHNENTYRWAIYGFLITKRYSKALAMHEAMSSMYTLTINDYTNAANMKIKLGMIAEALDDFTKVAELNPDNNSLSDRAFTLMELKRYEEAIEIFNEVIESDPSFSYAYANRGLAKLKTNDESGAISDIQYALQLKPDDVYGLRNMGIYHLHREEKTEALKLFLKAKSLYADVYLIDELIDRTK